MLPRRNWTPLQAADNSVTGGRRSRTRTSCPSEINASTTWLPRNPDPPTTRDRTTESTDAGRNWRAEDSSLQNLHMRRLQPGRFFELAGRPGTAEIGRAACRARVLRPVVDE